MGIIVMLCTVMFCNIKMLGSFLGLLRLAKRSGEGRVGHTNPERFASTRVGEDTLRRDAYTYRAHFTLRRDVSQGSIGNVVLSLSLGSSVKLAR